MESQLRAERHPLMRLGRRPGWGAAVAAAAAVLAAAPAQAAPGDLDPTFGVDGVAEVSSGVPARSVAASGSKAVIGGHTASGLVFARLLADGTPDPAFSGDGLATFALGGAQAFLGGLAVQADGKVVAAAVQDAKLVVIRLRSDGTADPAFGGDGRADLAAPSGPGFGSAPSIAILGDGRILVGVTGAISTENLRRVNAVRMLANGSPDSAFGSGGVAVGPSPRALDRAATVLASSGNPFIAGTRDDDSGLGATPVLVRWTAAGALDPFGSFPAALPPAGTFIPARYNRVVGAALDGDGTIVLGVARSDTTFNDAGDFGPTTRTGAVMRVTQAGARKASFSGDGIASVDVRRAGLASNPAVEHKAMARLADGRVVLAGAIDATAFLVRIGTDGTIDSAFGPPAETTHTRAGVARPPGLAGIERLTLDGEGRLLALVTQSSSATKFRVARLAQECLVFISCGLTAVVNPTSAVLQAGLAVNAPVGILVRRVVGRRTVRVGRVPFGPKRRGRRTIRWNLRVGGRRLPPGRYEIVMRAFEPSGKRVIDLSRAVRLTIRARRR